jgi:signal recognition particle receptor subunit alpha
VAGDTFRSGAVEQLKTHARCLECDIFAQGYAKDPASVATAALSHADQPAQPQYDVILVDTAGRMQNNAPLMSALTKLVETVPMDCTLLVVEALVGHDALSQFEMFKRAVRKIDALILTKYGKSHTSFATDVFFRGMP